ncbi:MAG TPA: hypothetical protein ENN42_11025 [Thioalkalivibrio sp.]|nr:hypothetical protein [Thioalkalivibrio sp.]
MQIIKGLRVALTAGVLALILGACATPEPRPDEADAQAATTDSALDRQLKECYLIGQMYLWSVKDFSQGLPLETAQDTSRRAFFNDVPQLADYQHSIAQVVYQERPPDSYPASRYLRIKYAECAKTVSDVELGQKSTMCFNLVLLSEVVHEMRDAGRTREEVAEAFAATNQRLESYTPMISAIFASDGSREDYNAGLYTRCLTSYALQSAE